MNENDLFIVIICSFKIEIFFNNKRNYIPNKCCSYFRTQKKKMKTHQNKLPLFTRSIKTTNMKITKEWKNEHI